MGILAYIARYGIQKATKRFGKALVDKARKAQAKVEAKLDKAQGIKSTTPGRTAVGRGAVIGKKRTKAYGRTKTAVGLAAGAAAGGAGGYAAGRTRGEKKRKKLKEENQRLRKAEIARRKKEKGFPFTGKSPKRKRS